MYGTHQEITERKRAEAELGAQRQKLDNIIQGTNLGTWEWNVQTGEVVINERWAEIIGYTLEELTPVSSNIWRSGVHPDDLSNSDDILQKHFNGDLDYYNAELRMRHKQGNWIWIRSLGKVSTWTEDGKPLLMYGTHQEITERKRTEEELRKANETLQSQLQEIQLLQAYLQEQALRDPLTGLYNRRYLAEMLERERIRCEREEIPLSIIVMDIDHFKNINDTYGHYVGDEFLKVIANLIDGQTRGYDIACRYGGEEFLLLLPGTSAQTAFERADELRSLCSKTTITHQGKELGASLSFGIATYPSDGLEGEVVLIKADRALYKSKENGRNRVTAWE